MPSMGEKWKEIISTFYDGRMVNNSNKKYPWYKEEEKRAKERVKAAIEQDRADRALRYQAEKTEADERRKEKERQVIWITICPRSSDPFYIVTSYIKWAKTSLTYIITH